MDIDEINLKKQIWGLLEDYGLLQRSWDRDIRDNFFNDFYLICVRYKNGGLKRIKKRLNTLPEKYKLKFVSEEIGEKELWLNLDKKRG